MLIVMMLHWHPLPALPVQLLSFVYELSNNEIIIACNEVIVYLIFEATTIGYSKLYNGKVEAFARF